VTLLVSLCKDVVNESVACGNWNDLLCKPRDITCSGTKLDAQSYDGDISRCETIQSLKCNDEVKYLPSGPTAICRILGVC
jgi:hypothetical protein